MSRSSLLSAYYQQPVTVDIPQLPGWVMGGSFNQIEEDIIGLNSKRQALENQQLAAQRAEIQLQNERSEREAAEQVAKEYEARGDQLDFDGQLQIGKKVALERGLYDQYVRLSQLEAQQQRQADVERRSAISQALQYGRLGADPFAEELLRAQGIDPATVFTPEFKAKTEKYFKSGGDIYGMSGGNPRIVIDGPERGSKPDKEETTWVTTLDGTSSRMVPVSEAQRLLDAGTHAIGKPSFDDQSKALLDRVREKENAEKAAAEASQPGLLERVIGSIAPASKPAPVMTPAPSGGPPAQVGQTFNGQRVIAVRVRPSPTASR